MDGNCVEPNEAFFASLIKNRQCHCVNCCLYDRDGQVEFIEADYLGGILESYAASQIRVINRLYGGAPTVVKRPARTLRSVLREYDAPHMIDYWSLDTEGSELSILKAFPFDEYSFRVITVEHNRLPVREKIREFLESRGYERVASMVIDDCYVKGWKSSCPPWRSQVWSIRGAR